jgi:hypothetical protein
VITTEHLNSIEEAVRNGMKIETPKLKINISSIINFFKNLNNGRRKKGVPDPRTGRKT